MGWEFLRKINDFKGLRNILSHIDDAGLKNFAEEFNWHQRKIFFQPFFRAMILSQIDKTKSLRDLGMKVNQDPLYKVAGAQMEVSVPALSMTLAKKDPAVYIKILEKVLQKIHSLGADEKRAREITKELNCIKDLLSSTKIFDSTTCMLSPKLSAWAKYDDDQAGIRVHLKFGGGYCGLEKVIVSSARDNDSKYFKDLLDLEHEKDKIYLHDCGYRKLTTYREITTSGNYFVTKLHSQIHYEILETISDKEYDLPNGWKHLSDQKIILGRDEKLHDVTYRVVIGRDHYGNTIKVLTNFLDKTPEQIFALYTYRWTIEIVFRWLKHTLKMKKFISTSPNGIVCQIVAALIVYCLLVLNQNRDMKTISPKLLINELEITTHWLLLLAGIFIGLNIKETKIYENISALVR